MERSTIHRIKCPRQQPTVSVSRPAPHTSRISKRCNDETKAATPTSPNPLAAYNSKVCKDVQRIEISWRPTSVMFEHLVRSSIVRFVEHDVKDATPTSVSRLHPDSLREIISVFDLQISSTPLSPILTFQYKLRFVRLVIFFAKPVIPLSVNC